MASRPIDEKIVKMKLDNSDFKRKAAETTGIFGKITAGLNKIPGVNLGKTAGELNNINTAAKGIKMDAVGTAVQGVSAKFTAMSVIATTALATIVNQAVNAGTRLGKALSLDQVTAGFQEYEIKMGSIQTILANTAKHGTTLDDVTRELNTLNEYADKTIYNFADMTKNIGLFTNAGLELESSTSMIKGFSNMAAASGTNSERAAGAAYQLSQGLSQGYLMQMDWMSLTNAGMGNDNMKNDLIALGQEMGTLDRTTEDTLKNWKEALSDDQWLTTDVMSTYLQTMAGDIGEAELLTMGLSQAQVDLMLSNAKMGEDAATKVRTFTQLMDTLKEGIGSGWAQSFELVLGDFNEATELFSSISDNLGEAVGKSAEARNKFLGDIADGGGFLNIFDGIKNATKPVVQIFSALKTAWKMVFPPKSAADVIKITEAFKEFTAGLKLVPERVTQITNIFRGVFSLFSTVWEIVKRLGAAFVQLIPEGTGGSILDLIEKVAKMSTSFNKSVKEGNGLTRFIDGLGTVLGKVGGFLSTAGEKVIDFATNIKKHLGTAIDWIKEKMEPLGEFIKETFGGSVGDEALGAGLILGIIAVVKAIRDALGGDEGGGLFDSIKEMVGGISETFGSIGEAINNFASSIKYANLILIAVAIGILAVSLKTLEGIDAKDLAKGITALATAMSIMIVGMMVMSKFNVGGGLRVAATLIALAAATNIMASALKKISDLDTGELIRGVGGLVGVVTALSVAIIVISKFGGKVKVGSLQLLALAAAVVILAEAVETMSEIDTGSLFKAIGALALIFASLAAFLKIVDGVKFGVGSALGVLAVAAAVKILVTAIEDIAEFDVNTLVKGLATITAILLAVALFSKVAGGPQMALAGAGMLLIAGAINAMVGPVTTFAGMSWEELAKGMAAMAASLIILAGAAYLMTGGIVGALGVIAMAVALKLLVEPIERFAAMSWGEMLKGFAGAAIGLGLMAGAALLLTPAIPSMLGFGAAIALMGLAMLAAGLGLSLFGTGLVTLATLTAGSVAAIVSALSLLIQGLGTLIVEVVEFVVELGLALIGGLRELIPELILLAGDIVLALVDGLATYVPEIVTKGGELAVGLLQGLEDEIPAVITAAASLMNALAQAVVDNAPIFLNAWLTIMAEVAVIMVRAGAAVIDALFGWIPGVGAITSQIGDTAELNIREAFDAQKVAVDKGNEFAGGLGSTEGTIESAGMSAGASAIDGIVANKMLPIGSGMGGDFASSLAGTKGLATTSGKTIGGGSLAGVATTNLAPIGKSVGSDYASSLADTKNLAQSSGKLIGAGSKTGADSTNLSIVGTGKGRDFASSLSATKGQSTNSGSIIGNAARSAADGISLTQAGTGAGTEYASGLGSKAGASRSSGTNLANSGKTGAAGVSLTTTGTNFGAGFASGISAKSVLSSVTAAGKRIASLAKSAVSGWLDIRSPSRVMMKDGGYFGEGFAIGIANSAKQVAGNAKGLAVKAKDTLTQFVDGFELPDNELHFKAVVDYEKVDLNKFGNLSSGIVIPNVSTTQSLAATAGTDRQRISNPQYNQQPTERKENDATPTTQKSERTIQIVTPDKREIARFVVDDVTEFQQLKIATDSLF